MPFPHFHPHSSDNYTDQRSRMLDTPIPALLCTLAAPTIVSMLITSLYNMADTYFVSQINTSASAAVGIVFSIMAIIQAVGFTVGGGSGSISSRLLGSNDYERANVYATSGVLTALVLGVALSVLGMAGRRQLIWLLGSTDTIYPYALNYAGYILLGAPVMILSLTLNNLLRWQGKATQSVVGLTIGGVLNIILDPIFIFALNMGISGAGAATLLSQCVSLAILAGFFVMGDSELRIRPGYISRTPRIYLAILKQGMPSLFRQGVLAASTMSINFSAKIYGDAAVAALAIVSKVFMMIQSITIGFGQGFQPVLGYNYGAGRLERVKQALVFSIKVCTIVLAVGAAIGFIFSPQIITVFRRDDPLVISIGTRAFRYQCLTLPLGAVIVFANMIFQALGKSFRATVLAISRQGLCIPLVFLLSGAFGLTGLEVTQTVSDLLAFLISAPMLLAYFKWEFGKE